MLGHLLRIFSGKTLRRNVAMSERCRTASRTPQSPRPLGFLRVSTMRATPSSIAVRFAIAGVAFLAVTSCERERRDFATNPTDSTTADPVRMSQVVPGGSEKYSQQINPSEDNAYALAEGKRLFSWYNCVGCHAQGGGGSGPALMDDVWIYGSEPANIFATIVEGRPNGMPSFGGHIPDEQVWQLVAYVRSMSGLVPKDAAPSRNDDIQSKPGENRNDPVTPALAAPPASSERSQ